MGGTTVRGWRTADIHQAILTSFGLSAERYTLTQVRYDLRKMRAHGLLERDGRRYAYQLTPKGIRVALLFVLFHKRVCGPLANSLFERPPSRTPPAGKIEAAYHKGDQSIQRVIDLLAA
jgi:Winged helix DNA-binding domain